MLQIGDTIKCRDNNDAVETMMDLAANGVKTDFLYEKDGEKGIWLIIEGIEYETNDIIRPD